MPRVEFAFPAACLHVFCDTCLEKYLGDADEVKKLEELI